MERLSRRQQPAAIDISWVSCRGVRSSLPFHTPCLYASVSVTPSSSSSSSSAKNGHRRPHRVKTPTDRAGGVNPEWDAPLRLYLPEPDAASPPPELGAGGKNNNNRKQQDRGGDGDGNSVLLVRFELKAEVAVLGDVLAASAAVPVPDLVADGRTRRVSYQLAGPDGRQPNGVISFSYAFHHQRNDDDDGELAVAPPCITPAVSSSSPVAQTPPTAAPPRLYPAIEWPPTEEIPIYHAPLPAAAAAAATLANSRYYPPPPPPPPSATPVEGVEPVAVYPPAPAPETSPPCSSLYPSVLPVPASGAMYPVVDLAPVSCYPPASPTPYGVEGGYGAAAAPRWDHRCLYG